MAPEYLLQGQFSIKSDVYSFGVLVLEIVSGQKVGGFVYQEGASVNLLSNVSIIYIPFFFVLQFSKHTRNMISFTTSL